MNKYFSLVILELRAYEMLPKVMGGLTAVKLFVKRVVQSINF